MTHTHPHPHPHAQGHAPLPPPSQPGSVVLDIGSDTGALLIHTDALHDGVEIEVSPMGDDARRTHAAVRPRHLPSGTVYSALITPLPAGHYTLWLNADEDCGRVEVTGAHVSEVHWP
ncbi:hypothetical protein [Streptacidiphilus monticola]|uniref:Phospholipase n=1 Tax=Streptacidiphilus monticola TaxID=2161674 RepID=A0ABW1G761_9ACTN